MNLVCSAETNSKTEVELPAGNLQGKQSGGNAMNITTRSIGNCRILDVNGRIVIGANTSALRNAIQEAVIGKPKRIVLNMGNVSYVDSPGIGELVYNYNHVKEQGSNLVLLNLTKRIRQLLVIAKLVTVFEIFDSEEMAVV
jgi:anti-sigma B factor antagonist